NCHPMMVEITRGRKVKHREMGETGNLYPLRGFTNLRPSLAARIYTKEHSPTYETNVSHHVSRFHNLSGRSPAPDRPLLSAACSPTRRERAQSCAAHRLQ